MDVLRNLVAISLSCNSLKYKSKIVASSFIEKYLSNFNSWKEVDNCINYCLKNNIDIVHFKSSCYSDFLRDIIDFPIILFCKGNTKLLKKDSFSVVGSRNMSLYGEKLVDYFIPFLVKSFCIVSGLAAGVDGAVHKKVLEEKGETIAVLGTGVDIVYPKKNENIYEEILEKNGLIVSEFFPGTNPNPKNFPQRNRIISGLSHGLLVVEAAKHSGSLITAGLSSSYNRDVFAIPNPLFSKNSIGVNSLIKRGAIVATEAEDILNHYVFLNKNKK